MHNWIQLYNEERNNRLDYRGYIAPRGSSRNWRPNNDDQLVTIQFRWNGGIKPVSSSFIGTSPEFEVALYTICFYTGEVDNIVRVGPYRVKVTCYRWSDRRTNIDMISTSFPGEVPPDEDMVCSLIYL
jgi:poly(U)-specific endoribonuclease